MLNIIFFLLVTIHCQKAKGAKPEVYEEDADSLFQSILGDVYTIKHIYPISNKTTAAEVNKTKIRSNYEDKSNFTVSNVTKFDYEMRKLKELIHNNESSVPNFDEDVIELVTRRFDDIQTRRKHTVAKDVVRRPENLLQDVNRTISIMEQFVYSTRNRLPYAQLLRKKYKTQLRYKVGFCLALVRNLKQQQMVLYNSYKRLIDKLILHVNYKVHEIQYRGFHLMIYERILRLDVDIKDVIKLIKKLEKQRREEEDPKDDLIVEDNIGNSSFPGGLPILDFSGGNGTQPARRIGWIDPRALELKNIHEWRRITSTAQNPVSLKRGNSDIVKAHVNSDKSLKKSHKKSRLWAPSYKIKRTDNDVYKNLYR